MHIDHPVFEFYEEGFLKFFLIMKNYCTVLILILYRTLTKLWVLKKN